MRQAVRVTDRQNDSMTVWQNSRAAKEPALVFVIFVESLSYTLYTYKKSRGYTDDLPPSAVAFIPESFTQRLSPSVGLTRAPVRIPPREAHLPGWPADTFLLSVTFWGAPGRVGRRTPSRPGGHPAARAGGCWWWTALGSAVSSRGSGS